MKKIYIPDKNVIAFFSQKANATYWDTYWTNQEWPIKRRKKPRNGLQ